MISKIWLNCHFFFLLFQFTMLVCKGRARQVHKSSQISKICPAQLNSAHLNSIRRFLLELAAWLWWSLSGIIIIIITNAAKHIYLCELNSLVQSTPTFNAPHTQTDKYRHRHRHRHDDEWAIACAYTCVLLISSKILQLDWCPRKLKLGRLLLLKREMLH